MTNATIRNADIMVCDSMNVSMMQMLEKQLQSIGNKVQASLLEDAHTYHAPIEGMAEIATKAGVKHLLLSHIMPAITDEQIPQFTRCMWRASTAGTSMRTRMTSCSATRTDRRRTCMRRSPECRSHLSQTWSR